MPESARARPPPDDGEAGQASPDGTIYAITGNLSGHDSKSTRARPEDHPRIRHAFTPKRARRLNPQEGRRRIVRRQALAGQALAGPGEITHATGAATARLGARTRSWARGRPWTWGRPQPRHRSYRRRFVYALWGTMRERGVPGTGRSGQIPLPWPSRTTWCGRASATGLLNRSRATVYHTKSVSPAWMRRRRLGITSG